MSLIRRMTLARHGLGAPMDMYGQVNGDPIFFPLFSTVLGSFGSITIAGNLTVAGLASAIAAGGGYKEFPV